jgi:hypothetical protein
MTAFFIGCSFTHGDDLDNKDRDAWPSLVSKHKGIGFVNGAVSGSSNERIVYQLLKNVDDHEQFYIAWSDISRFTRYYHDNHEVNFNVHLRNTRFAGDPNFLNYGTLHYKYWYNELFAFKLWLQQIVLVQTYLDSKSKKYLMINTVDNHIKRWTSDWKNFNNSVKSLVCFDSMNDEQLLDEHLEIKKLEKQIDRDRFLGWGDITLQSLTAHCPKGPTNHPLQQGHQAIATYILSHDTN